MVDSPAESIVTLNHAHSRTRSRNIYTCMYNNVRQIAVGLSVAGKRGKLTSSTYWIRSNRRKRRKQEQEQQYNISIWMLCGDGEEKCLSQGSISHLFVMAFLLSNVVAGTAAGRGIVNFHWNIFPASSERYWLAFVWMWAFGWWFVCECVRDAMLNSTKFRANCTILVCDYFQV